MTARLQHRPGDFIGPGQQQYRVLEKLGCGGMGTVYRVENKLTGNIYAVKECDVLDDSGEGQLSREQALEVFLAEGREVERLQHRGIPRGFLLADEAAAVKVCRECGVHLPEEAVICPHRPLDEGPDHSLQKVGRRLYLFMTFIDGLDGAEACRQMAKPLVGGDLVKVTGWLAEIAETLGFLHARDLIHRDVKPENLRITPSQTYLLDFGLVLEEPQSNRTRRLNQSTAFHGTQGFAPQEQIHGHPRYASDSFALAMTLLALATGEDPSLPEVSRRFCETDPRTLVPAMNEPLAQCVARARSIRPELRPKMEDWVAVLARVKPSSKAQKNWQETKRLRSTGPVFRQPKAPIPLRPGRNEPKVSKRQSPWFRVASMPRPNGRITCGVVIAFLLLLVFWPRNSAITFEVEALPGAMIYKRMDDLRHGDLLKGGEILVVGYAKNGQPGNWLRVTTVNGKPNKGFLLRSKVFRSRS